MELHTQEHWAWVITCGGFIITCAKSRHSMWSTIRVVVFPWCVTLLFLHVTKLLIHMMVLSVHVIEKLLCVCIGVNITRGSFTLMCDTFIHTCADIIDTCVGFITICDRIAISCDGVYSMCDSFTLISGTFVYKCEHTYKLCSGFKIYCNRKVSLLNFHNTFEEYNVLCD